MAKGYDTNKERLQTLSLFGKDLARRSKSTCELSLSSGVPLKIYEIAPVPKEPIFENCLFLCEDTIQQLDSPKKHLKSDKWRHLRELIWSELPQVQLMSVRILSYIAKSEPWAQEILDEAYLEEELADLAASAPLS
ncbi:hypothetical protein OAB00_02145 [Akkermansiaceae bacterium]|nr:hypothetical protein [Akkermansiaceae bacterium]